MCNLRWCNICGKYYRYYPCDKYTYYRAGCTAHMDVRDGMTFPVENHPICERRLAEYLRRRGITTPTPAATSPLQLGTRNSSISTDTSDLVHVVDFDAATDAGSDEIVCPPTPRLDSRPFANTQTFTEQPPDAQRGRERQVSHREGRSQADTPRPSDTGRRVSDGTVSRR